MLKRLSGKYWPMILFLIFIGAILYVSHYAEERKTQQPKDAQSRGPQTAISPNDGSKSAEEAPKAEHHPDFIDTFTWPEGATVWALFLTLLVIAWQSVETRDAARAGLLNAQAVINAERAWVVMIIERDEEFPRLFRVKAKNCGSTPAKIVAASQQWCVIENADKMPKEPQYGHGRRFVEGVFLFPGESQAMMEFGRDHLRMPPIGYEPTGEDEFQRVKEGQASCIVFGNVVYRDILSSPDELERETRWCSLLKLGDAMDEFILTRGRDGYTKHT
jgi:hypothetical protein